MREGLDVTLCGGWLKPVGSADGDQAEAKTVAVPHRTENVSFPTIRVSVHASSIRVVRVHRLVRVNDGSGRLDAHVPPLGGEATANRLYHF